MATYLFLSFLISVFLFWMLLGKIVYCFLIGGFDQNSFIVEWKAEHLWFDYVAFCFWPVLVIWCIIYIVAECFKK